MYMKKWVSYILSAVMMFCLLTGCGGGGETAEPEKEGVAKGYWVVEKMVMEGNEFDKETMEGIFGEAESIMALAFDGEGSIDGIYFGEPLKGTYTGAEDALEMDLMGEKATGVCKDGVLEIKIGEDAAFTLKNQEEMPASIASNPWATYKPDFDADETMAMSSFMNYGRYIVQDDVLYGLTHSKSGSGNLAAMPFHMKGDFPQFDDTKILDEKGSAVYLCMDGDYLYYLRDWEAVCRVKTDGSDAKVLYEGMCDYLQIHDGRLYFTDEDYHFVSTDMDGKDLKTVVDKEIYYPYFICADWMVFQDNDDDESLHLYHATSGEELNITYVPSYAPVLDGKYLYYTDYTDGLAYLCRVDMSDPDTFRWEGSELPLRETGFVIDEEYVYTANGISVPKADWQKLTDTKDVTAEVEVYASKDYKVYHEFDDEGLIGGKYLMSKAEGGGTSFK